MNQTSYMRETVRHPPLHVFDVIAEASAIGDQYRNMVLNQINGACLRLAVMTGDYPWHTHPHSDELFLVVEGCLILELAGGLTMRLRPWQAVTIPAGTVHRTRAEGRTVNLCVEQLAAETVFLEPDATPPAE